MKFDGVVHEVSKTKLFCLMIDENGLVSKCSLRKKKVQVQNPTNEIGLGSKFVIENDRIKFLPPIIWDDKYEEEVRILMEELFPAHLFETVSQS